MLAIKPETDRMKEILYKGNFPLGEILPEVVLGFKWQKLLYSRPQFLSKNEMSTQRIVIPQ